MFLGRANWPQVPECRDGPRGGMTRLFPHTLAHVVDRPRVANPEDLFSAEIRARSRTTPARESHQPPHCAPQAGQGRSLAVLAARRGVLIANTLGARCSVRGRTDFSQTPARGVVACSRGPPGTAFEHGVAPWGRRSVGGLRPGGWGPQLRADGRRASAGTAGAGSPGRCRRWKRIKPTSNSPEIAP